MPISGKFGTSNSSNDKGPNNISHSRGTSINYVQGRPTTQNNTVERRKKLDDDYKRTSSQYIQDSSRVQSTIHLGKNSHIERQLDESRKSFDQRS